MEKNKNIKNNILKKDDKNRKKLEKKNAREEKKQLNAKKKEERKKERILKKNLKIQQKKSKKDAQEKQLLDKSKIVEKAREREHRLTFTEGSYDLDNAAQIYPPSRTGAWNASFRVAAILKEEVNPEILQKALDSTMDRFPFYNVVLKRGVFWHYFQVLQNKPKIQKERNYPCSVFDFRGDKPIFRVLYYGKKISLESFHALGDGYGGMVFLNTLLINYIIHSGRNIDLKKCFINPYDIFDKEETEDAFLRYADFKNHESHRENKAWQIKGSNLEAGHLNVISGIIDTNDLKAKAKELGYTINELLLGTLFYALLKTKQESKNKKKNIKVSMPIDCRRHFPSRTMRNFSSYKNIELIDENLDFNGILNFVHTEMQDIGKEFLLSNINSNVYYQRNPFVRILPLQLKNFILRICFRTFGESLYTTSFSNLGLLKVPEEFEDLVERYDVMIGRAKINGINVATCSYNNQTVVTFTRKYKEATAEKHYFRQLSSLGLKIKIETN